MKKRLLLFFGLILLYILPLAFVSTQIFLGTFPFWYDNARDLLQASSKLTLIGPTTGVPGIFYGPYWIWLLSIALTVSQDPRVVDFMVATIPYFIFLPLILLKLKKVFSPVALLIGWTLFITGFSRYTMQLWNPYPAPLLFAALVMIITFTDFKKATKKTYLQILLAGFMAGLVANFHLSFGTGVLTGSCLFFTLQIIFHRSLWKRYILYTVIFIAGIISAFAPFFLFELKHGFNQIQTIITVITSREVLVGQTGLTNPQILNELAQTAGKLFGVSGIVAIIVSIGLFTSLLFILKQQSKSFTDPEKRFIGFVGTIFITLFSIYLTARYPAWSYHFIGTEMILTFFIIFIAHRSILLRRVLMVVAGISLVFYLSNTAISIQKIIKDPHIITSMATEQYIITWIAQDANRQDYDVYAYSPAIYSYEYDYLFNWMLKRPLHMSDTTSKKIVYLIIPNTTDDIRKDFINYKTPNADYQTTKVYSLPDKTTILKREKP
ncbi:MAG: hypothetical protein AAB553_07580 [Patescibacteria group bacterium]